MLGAIEFHPLTAQLTSLSGDSHEHNNQLQDLCEIFNELLEDYSALRAQLEEVVDQRDVYKKQARGQVQSRSHNFDRLG
jgi:uncharacterized coiled-coil DUF342 family protein